MDNEKLLGPADEIQELLKKKGPPPPFGTMELQDYFADITLPIALNLFRKLILLADEIHMGRNETIAVFLATMDLLEKTQDFSKINPITMKKERGSSDEVAQTKL